MDLGYKKEYNLWLSIYILANVIGAVIMLDTGMLIGDVIESRLYDNGVLLLALFLVLASYYIILKPFYNFVLRIKMPRLVDLETNERANKVLGYIIVVLQIGFLVFNITEGVNTAGVATKSTSAFSFVWVFIPIDLVFLIYYVLFRNTPMFKYNLTVYLLSNIVRGWAAVLLYVMFFEWCRMIRAKKVNYGLILFLAAVFFFLYPYIHYMKLVIRTIGANADDLSLFYSMFSDSISSRSYAEFFEEGVAHLVGRFQVTSVVVEIIHFQDRLRDQFDAGNILPFWKDGLPQLTYRKVMGIDAPFNIGVYLTDFFFPRSDIIGRWNINVGFVGWFFIAPTLIPFYLIYNAALCVLSVFLMKQFSLRDGMFDVVWMAWLILLMPGWHMAFVGFNYSILLIIFMVKLAKFLARFRLLKETPETIYES